MKLLKRIFCVFAIIMIAIGNISISSADTIPLLQVSASLSSNSITIGSSVTVMATASGGQSNSYSYKMNYAKSSSPNSWVAIPEGNSESVRTFKPTEVGTYYIQVIASCGYESTSQLLSLTVTAAPTNPKISINASVSSTSVYVNENITVSIIPSGGSGSYKYAYWYRATSGTDTSDHFFPGTWNGSSGYVTAKSQTITRTTPGKYVLTAVVYDANDTSKYAKDTFTVEFKDKSMTSSGTIDKTSIVIGDDVTLTSAATGSSGSFNYKIDYKIDNGAVTTLQSYSTATSKEFKPTVAGKYTFIFTAKSSTGATASNTVNLTVKNIQSTAKISKSEVFQGETIELTAGASGGYTPYEYRFDYKDSAGNNTILKDFSSSASAVFSSEKAGKYTITIYTKDSKGNVASESFDVTVKQYELVDETTFSAKSITIGGTIKVQMAVSGGAEPYSYKVYQQKEGDGDVWEEAGDTVSVDLTTPDVGTYNVKVVITDKYNNKVETITTVYVTSQVFTRDDLNTKIDDINDWLDEIGYERVADILKDAVRDGMTFNEAYAKIDTFLIEDLEVKSDNPVDNYITTDQETKLKDFSLSYYNALVALEDEARTDFSYEYSDLDAKYTTVRTANLESLHNAGFFTKLGLKIINQINSALNGFMTTFLTTNGIGLDYIAFAEEYSGLFNVFATSFVVLFLSVNLLETTIQYELFTIKGGAKFAGKLILCKVWVDLAVRICTLITQICSELLSSVLTTAGDVIHFTPSDLNLDAYEAGSSILAGEILNVLTNGILNIFFFVIVIIILGYIFKIFIKLTIRTFELGMMMVISPIFFAAWVGDTTKIYFKKFISAFISIAAEVIFMGVVWFAFTYWLQDYTTSLLNMSSIGWMFGESLALFIVLLAVVKMMYKPPRAIENLIS